MIKFKNFCVVVIGPDLTMVKEEIGQISDSIPNLFDAHGLIIATFTSGASVKELTEFFKINGHNFLLFDLDEENSGFSFNNIEILNGLFGFLPDKKILEDKTNEINNLFTSTKIKEKSLEEQLRIAIEDEDYETATKIRDLINNQK